MLQKLRRIIKSINFFFSLFVVILIFAGEDGKEFVTVEHCGDDYLAALADSVQENEDWDDLQAIESEACGVLNSIFEEECANKVEEIVDKSSSFTNDEDSDLEILQQKDVLGRSSTTFNLKNGQAHHQCPSKAQHGCPSKSLNLEVTSLLPSCTIFMLFIMTFNLLVSGCV